MLWPFRQPANKQTPNAKPMLYWRSDCRKYFSIRTKTAVAHTMFPGRLLIKVNSRSNEETPFVNPTEVFDALAWLAKAHRNGSTELSSRTNGTGPRRCASRGGCSLAFPHWIDGPGATPRGRGHWYSASCNLMPSHAVSRGIRAVLHGRQRVRRNLERAVARSAFGFLVFVPGPISTVALILPTQAP